MPEPSEHDLVARAANGCSASFTLLVQRYRDRLFRFLALRCGNRADAEDAVQEAFAAAWRYLPGYDSRWRFSTWLYRIGLNNLPRPGPAEGPPPDALEADVDVLADVEAGNAWRLARQHLSDDAAAALWLRYGEDMSIREIAGTLSRSAAWVKVTLLRSRRRLAAIVEGDRL